jgi:hypothetical protein
MMLCWSMTATVSLPHADYSDTFRTESDAFHTAEAWARASFEPGSRRDVDAKQLVWRRVLQLRLGPLEAPDCVAGWHIVENTDRRLVLGAESWHLTARLVFEAKESGARVTTRVAYRHLPGRAVWSVVGPIHRRAVPDILAAARRRLAR